MIKISYNWIQQHIQEQLPSAEIVADTIHRHAFEVESSEIKNNTTVFDIAVLPDRAGDCLSHCGIAREVAALLRLSKKEQIVTPLPKNLPLFPVDIQDARCDKYTAVRIDGVTIGPSPKWLQEALESIGQKSINNVVDVTNFVLNDSGQPVHVFDAEKIDGGIIVRSAKEGETTKLLGGEEKVLKETDLVIADYLGVLAIAGVKGGVTAEVTEHTTSIVIEIAHFDAVSIRKTSRRLGLITDASKRFENNISPAFVTTVTKQIVSLIQTIAGGTVSAITEKKKEESEGMLRTLSFSVADVTRVLGPTITSAHIEDVLSRYHYEYKKENTDHFILTVPYWRSDIVGIHDITEEIGRVVGYDTLPMTPLPFVPVYQPNEIDIQIATVRAWCTEQGYREVYTYSFRSKGEIGVAYGAKGKEMLRSNLSDGVKESYERNRINAPLLSIDEVKIFEVGTVFFSEKEVVHVALCDKGILQELSLDEFIKEKNILIHNGLAEHSLVVSNNSFVPWSSFPFITRDIAVWVSEDDGKKKLLEIADLFAKKHCVRAPFLFDEFSKDGRTSIALRFVFQSKEKTLTDTEVQGSFDELISLIKSEKAFEIR